MDDKHDHNGAVAVDQPKQSEIGDGPTELEKNLLAEFALAGMSRKPDDEAIVDNGKAIHEHSDGKPRIILTFRTSEADPDAYFSTCNLKPKEHIEADVYGAKDDSVNGNSSTADLSNDSNLPSKRNLRRVSNVKESVLQSAIALKEKSFGIPLTSVYKRSKSPKGILENSHKLLKVKPRNHIVYRRGKLEDSCSPVADNSCAVDTNSAKADDDKSEDVKLSGETENCKCHSEVMDNFNNSAGSGPSRPGNLSYVNCYRPAKKRRRYFKGLSYSFGNKRYARRRKPLLCRGRLKYSLYDSSELDTDSQNTFITADELCGELFGCLNNYVDVFEFSLKGRAAVLRASRSVVYHSQMKCHSSFLDFADSKSDVLSTDSSHSISVLYKLRGSEAQNCKYTSLDVLSKTLNYCLFL